MTKLTHEQVAQLPELLETKCQAQVAKLFGVKPQTISYWIRQYKKRGIEMPKTNRLSTIDEIIKKRNEQANITL